MRKLYLIVADVSSESVFSALTQHLQPYSGKLALHKGVWLIAAAGSAARLHSQIVTTIGRDKTVFVFRISADLAWSGPEATSNWLSRQLAAVTNQ